jgi:hypothetical protein
MLQGSKRKSERAHNVLGPCDDLWPVPLMHKHGGPEVAALNLRLTGRFRAHCVSGLASQWAHEQSSNKLVERPWTCLVGCTKWNQVQWMHPWRDVIDCLHHLFGLAAAWAETAGEPGSVKTGDSAVSVGASSVHLHAAWHRVWDTIILIFSSTF